MTAVRQHWPGICCPQHQQAKRGAELFSLSDVPEQGEGRAETCATDTEGAGEHEHENEGVREAVECCAPRAAGHRPPCALAVIDSIPWSPVGTIWVWI